MFVSELDTYELLFFLLPKCCGVRATYRTFTLQKVNISMY